MEPATPSKTQAGTRSEQHAAATALAHAAPAHCRPPHPAACLRVVLQDGGAVLTPKPALLVASKRQGGIHHVVRVHCAGQGAGGRGRGQGSGRESAPRVHGHAYAQPCACAAPEAADWVADGGSQLYKAAAAGAVGATHQQAVCPHSYQRYPRLGRLQAVGAEQ